MNAQRTVWTLIVALGLLLGATPGANAYVGFGKPTNLQSVVPVVDGQIDAIDCLSDDGLEMYISTPRPGGQGNTDLWVLRRATSDSAWTAPENLGPAVNGPGNELLASLSTDGLTLYFCSDRPHGDDTRYDLFLTTRAKKTAPWGPAVNLGATINSPTTDAAPWISRDGLELYFESYRAGGSGLADIYVAKRTRTDAPWGDPVNLGTPVNSTYNEQYLSLSSDGLVLLFADADYTLSALRSGGYGASDLWMTKRASLSAPWQAPVNLGPLVNSPGYDGIPRISPDGRTLYFDREYATWQAPIIPIVDFNADGKVDLVDLVMLIDNWGTDKTLCDIGPMPWGDGKVDIDDLKVFMTYYEKENPPKSNDGK